MCLFACSPSQRITYHQKQIRKLSYVHQLKVDSIQSIKTTYQIKTDTLLTSVSLPILHITRDTFIRINDKISWMVKDSIRYIQAECTDTIVTKEIIKEPIVKVKHVIPLYIKLLILVLLIFGIICLMWILLKKS